MTNLKTAGDAGPRSNHVAEEDDPTPAYVFGIRSRGTLGGLCLPLEHGDLVREDQDLGVLCAV